MVQYTSKRHIRLGFPFIVFDTEKKEVVSLSHNRWMSTGEYDGDNGEFEHVLFFTDQDDVEYSVKTHDRHSGRDVESFWVEHISAIDGVSGRFRDICTVLNTIFSEIQFTRMQINDTMVLDHTPERSDVHLTMINWLTEILGINTLAELIDVYVRLLKDASDYGIIYNYSGVRSQHIFRYHFQHIMEHNLIHESQREEIKRRAHLFRRIDEHRTKGDLQEYMTEMAILFGGTFNISDDYGSYGHYRLKSHDLGTIVINPDFYLDPTMDPELKRSSEQTEKE